MANASKDDDDAITGINVTPLVDVTLVLLIIFMVTAKLIAGHGIPLDLPKAATAGATQTMLTLTVDAAGSVLANGQPVDDQALRAQTQQALRQNPEFRTVIALGPVDRAAAYTDLGESYLKGGKRAEAKTQILAALEIAPGYERAQGLLLKLVDR